MTDKEKIEEFFREFRNRLMDENFKDLSKESESSFKITFDDGSILYYLHNSNFGSPIWNKIEVSYHKTDRLWFGDGDKGWGKEGRTSSHYGISNKQVETMENTVRKFLVKKGYLPVEDNS